MRMATWVASLAGGTRRKLKQNVAGRTEEILRSRRLEDRCMLDASYTLVVPDILHIDNFDGSTSDLEISTTGDVYEFKLDAGTWNTTDGPMAGLSVAGNSLFIDLSVLTPALTGITVDDSSGVPISIDFGNVESTTPGLTNQDFAINIQGVVTQQTNTHLFANQVTITAASVDLSNTGNRLNRFGATASVVSVTNTVDLVLLHTDVDSIELTLGGNLSQTSALNVNSSITLTSDSGADVDLSAPANNLGSSIIVAGSDIGTLHLSSIHTGDTTVSASSASINGPVILETSDNLHIDGLSTSSTLTAVTGGDITQTGAITVSGATLSSGASIILNSSANHISGTVAITGNASAVTLQTESTGTLQLDTSSANFLTSLSIDVALGSLNLAGQLTTTDATFVLGSSLTQSGALVANTLLIQGVSSLTVALDHVDNNINTALTLTGSLSTIDVHSAHAGILAVDGSTAGTIPDLTFDFASGGISLSQMSANSIEILVAGDIEQTGAITGVSSLTVQGTGSTSSNVTLNNSANNLSQNIFISGNIADLQLTSTHSVATTADFSGVTTLNNVALNFSNAAVVLAAMTTANDLSVVAGSHITQTGALDIGGTLTVTTTTSNDDVTLNNVSNVFHGSIFATGTIDDLRITSSHLGNNLFDATGATALETVDLHFSNAGVVIGGAAFLGANATRTLSITAAGDVTQTGAITNITGLTATMAGGFSFLLDHAGNNLNSSYAFLGSFLDISLRSTHTTITTFSVSSLTGLRNVTLHFAGRITLASMTLSGTLDLTAGNIIAQSTGAALDIGTALRIASSGPTFSVTLARAGNKLSNSITVDGISGDLTLLSTDFGITSLNTSAAPSLGSVSLTFANSGIAFTSLTSSGTLTVTAGGSVTQSGPLVINTSTTLTISGDADVVLDNSANDLGTLSVSGDVHNLSLTSLHGTALTFDASTVTTIHDLILNFANASVALRDVAIAGSLSVTAGGAITQTNAITVGATTHLAIVSVGSSITLNNASNDLGTVISLGGNIINATLRSTETLSTLVSAAAATISGNATFTLSNAAVDLANLTVGNTLNVTSGGAITQSATISVGSALNLTTSSNQDVVLNDSTNQLSNAITVTSSVRDVTLVSATSGTTTVDLSGVASLRDVNLDFQSSAVTLAALNASGALNLAAGSAITQLGAITVAHSTQFSSNGGSVVLDHANNDLTELIGLSGTIAQLSLTSIHNEATLFDTSGVSGLTDVTINFANATISLGNVTASGTFDITSGGNVGQIGAITGIAGLSVTVAGGGDILLDSSLNSLGASLIIAGQVGNVTLRSTSAAATVFDSTAATSLSNVTLFFTNAAGINLAGLSATGSLDIHVLNEVTQSGVIEGITSLSITSLGGGAVTLNQALNKLSNTISLHGLVSDVTLVSASPGATSIDFTNASALHDVALNFSGGGVELSQLVATGGLSIVAAGDVSQTGFIAGITSLSLALTASANVALDQAANNLSNIITASGAVHDLRLASVHAGITTFTTASLPSVNDISLDFVQAQQIVLDGVAATGTLTVRANHSISQTGTITGVAALALHLEGPGNIFLADIANQLGPSVALTGNIHDLELASSSSTPVTIDWSTVTSFNDVSLTLTQSGLDLNTLTATGELNIIAAGTVTQSGAVTGVLQTSIQLTGNGDVILDNVGNNLSSIISLSGSIVDVSLKSGHSGMSSLSLAGATTLNDVTLDFSSASIELSDLNASGALDITVAGSLTQTTAISGITSFTVNSISGGDVVLVNSANDLSSNIQVLGAVNLLSLYSVHSGTTTLNASSASSLTTVNIDFVQSDVVLAGIGAAGSIQINALSNISQTGSIAASSSTTLHLLLLGDIDLADTANQLSSIVNVTGNVRNLSLASTDSVTPTFNLSSTTFENLSLVFSGASLVLGSFTTQTSLHVVAGGSITDLSDSQLHVTSGNAYLEAGGNIVLANDLGEAITVGGNATFISGASIDVGVIHGGIPDGADSGASVSFGSVTLVAPGGTIRVVEDDATQLDGVNAATLSLTSAGNITQTTESVDVSTELTLGSIGSTADIILGGNTNSLAPLIHISDSTNIRDLTLRSTNNTPLTLDFGSAPSFRNVVLDFASDIVLGNLSASDHLEITSGGDLTNSSGAVISSQSAAFTAGGSIVLGQSTGSLTVTGNASFTAAFNITLGILDLGGGNYSTTSTIIALGSVSLSATTGTARLHEIDDTQLEAVEVATLLVHSDGSILQGTSGLLVTNDAEFHVASGTGALTLTHTSNDLRGTIALEGDFGQVDIVNSAAGFIRLAGITATTGRATVTGDLNYTATNGSVVLSWFIVLGNMSIQTHTGISQDARLDIVGNTLLNVTGIGDVLLTSALNQLHSTVTLLGSIHDVSLTSATSTAAAVDWSGATGLHDVSLEFASASLTLSALNASGSLAIVAGGNVLQSGAITGISSLTVELTSTGSVVLSDALNTLSNMVTIEGHVAHIHLASGNLGTTDLLLHSVTGLVTGFLDFTNSALRVSAMTVSDAVIIAAHGGVLQTGAWVIANALSINLTAAGDVLLDHTANDLSGSITIDGALHDLTLVSNHATTTNTQLLNSGTMHDVTLEFTQAGVDLSQMSLTGSLSVTAANQISQSGVLTAGVSTSLTLLNAGNIQLDFAANDLSGDITIAGPVHDLSLASGRATATSFDLSGASSLNNVLLDFHNAPVSLGELTATGTLSIFSGGTITQTAALSGISALFIELLAGGDVLLNDSANSFAGLVSVRGDVRDISLASLSSAAITLDLLTLTPVRHVTLEFPATSLILPGFEALGNVSIIAGGSVTQIGTISISGSLSVALTTVGDILFSNASNDLSPTIAFSGAVRDVVLSSVRSGATALDWSAAPSMRDVTLNFTQSAISLNSLTAIGILSVVAGGDITQTGAITGISGAHFAVTTAADIQLDNAANDLSDFISLSGSVQNLALSSTNTSQTFIDWASITTFADVTLAFSSAGVNLESFVATGDLRILSGGTITQTGPIIGVATIELTLLQLGDIVLNHASNTLSSSITVNGLVNDLHLVSATAGPTQVDWSTVTTLSNVDLAFTAAAVQIAQLSAAGYVNIVAGGDITQTGAIHAGGELALTLVASGNITLNHASNQLSSDITIEGPVHDLALTSIRAAGTTIDWSTVTSFHDIALDFANAPLDLAQLTANGSLAVQSGGSVTQSGVISVGTSTHITLTQIGDIVLDNSNNDLSSSLVIAGTIHDVSISSMNALASALDWTSAVGMNDVILQFGSAAASLSNLHATGRLAVTSAGDITQSGAITGISSLDLTLTAIGNIELTNVSNTLAPTINITGIVANVALTSTNPSDTVVSMLGSSGLQDVTLSFADANRIELDQIVASGNLVVNVFGEITTSLSTNIDIGGNTALASFGGGSIWIGVNPLNEIASGTIRLGTLTFSTDGNATLAVTGDLTLTGDSSASDLTARATNSIVDLDDGRLTLLGDAIFEAGGQIVLADDASGTGIGALSVGGRATFTASGPIDVGVTSGGTNDGTASAATTAFGALTIVTPTSTARVHTDSDLILAGATNAASMMLSSSASIATLDNSNITVSSSATFVASDHISLMSDSGATSAAMFIGTRATFISGTTLDVGIEGGFGSGNDSAATVLLHDVEFQAPLGAQLSIDKSFTLVGSNSAATLALLSTDTIANTAATSLDITGNTYLSAQTIALGQTASGLTRLGGLTVDATTVTLHEDEAMEIAAIIANDATLSIAGSLTQTGAIDANSLAITLTLSGDVILQDPANRMGILSVSGVVQDLAITNSDNSAGIILLPAIVQNLDLNFTNAVVDLPSLTVAGDMTVRAGLGISNLIGSTIVVSGAAQFSSIGNDVRLGTNASDNIRFGTVTFSDADLVELHESDSTLLTGHNEAIQLTIRSAGSIEDAPVTQIDAFHIDFVAQSDIVLADTSSADSLVISGTSSFESIAGTSIRIGMNALGVSSNATVQLQDVRFNGLSADAQLREDTGISLFGINQLNSMLLDIAGSVQQVTTTELIVAGSMSVFSTDIIQLVDGTNYFGTITFIGTDVSLKEADATVLAGVNQAATWTMESQGALSMQDASTTLSVALANLSADSIDLSQTSGGSRNVLLGGIQFHSAGMVRVINGDHLQIVGTNVAQLIELDSLGTIADNDDTQIIVAGDATFRASANILLATATGGNGLLQIDGLATFETALPSLIIVGMTYIRSGPVSVSDADVRLGDIRFATSGIAGIRSDTSVSMTGSNSADSLTLISEFNNIATADASTLTVTGLADFSASTLQITGASAVASFGSIRFVGDTATIVESDSTQLDSIAAQTSFQLHSGGAIERTPGAGPVIVTGDLDLAATTGIGADSQLDIEAHTIRATTTSGDIELSNDATLQPLEIVISQLHTGQGSVDFEQFGFSNLTVQSVQAHGGDVSVTNEDGALTVETLLASPRDTAHIPNVVLTTGDILNDLWVGTITATGGVVQLTSTGRIESTSSSGLPSIYADTLELLADWGIGELTPLRAEVQHLSAINHTAGDVSVVLSASSLPSGVSVQVHDASTFLGDISIILLGDALGSGHLLAVDQVTVEDGDVHLQNHGDSLTVGTVDMRDTLGFSWDATLMADGGTGNVTFDSLQTDFGNVTIQAVGQINGGLHGNDAAVDIAADTLELAAGTGIVNLDIAVFEVSALTGNGDMTLDSFANLVGDLVTVHTLQTNEGTITFAQTGAEALDIVEARTASGSIIISNAGDTLTVFSAIAGTTATGDGNLTLSVHTSGDLLFDRLSAANDRITLSAADSIRELAGSDTSNEPDIFADTLIIANALGFGEFSFSNNPAVPGAVETTVRTLQANVRDQGLYLVNFGDLSIGTADGSLTGITATGEDIDITASSLDVFQSITNTHGDIALISESHILFDATVTVLSHSAVIQVFAPGTIDFTADGVLRTTTGQVGQAPTVIIVDPTDLGGITVSQAGEAELTILLDDLKGSNFQIFVDWGDATTPELLRPEDAVQYDPLVDGLNPLFVGGKEYTYGHTYLSNPNANDSSAFIPVTVFAEYDFRATSSEQNGIQLFGEGGVRIVSSTTVELIPPGQGFGISVPLEKKSRVESYAPPRLVSQALEYTQPPVIRLAEIQASASGGVSVATPEKQLVLRVVSPAGEEGENIPLSADQLNDLQALFQRLPDDRYRIYQINEDGSELLVSDVMVRQGRPFPPTDENDNHTELPVSIETNDEQLDADDAAQEEMNEVGDEGNEVLLSARTIDDISIAWAHVGELVELIASAEQAPDATLSPHPQQQTDLDPSVRNLPRALSWIAGATATSYLMSRSSRQANKAREEKC